MEKKQVYIHPLLLAVISGVLLWLSWPTSPLTFLIFVAWVPILWLESQSKKLVPFWAMTTLALLIWNGTATWWVGNTPVPVSGIVANVLNALIMSVPWIGYFKAKRRLGKTVGFIALIAYWLTFEYVHHQWELSWPWLTLGNVFASRPDWVQWYEWTGTTGGGLWVLVVNVLIFEALALTTKLADKKGWKSWRRPGLALLLPICCSIGILCYRSLGNGMMTVARHDKNFVLVQPNINPYSEKFQRGTEQLQLARLIGLSESKIDSNTAFVVWPETSLPYYLDEDELSTTIALAPLRAFLARHPQLHLITGIDSYKNMSPGYSSAAIRRDPNTGRLYENYNTAGQFDSAFHFELYHKGKLVPGAEIMPYTWLFGFLESMSLDMGGTSGTLGRGSERVVFSNGINAYKVAPIICYESIYSDYVTQYVRNGANVLAIITNDGWWDNTQGHKQHMQYARLRAIETRRWVVRSANTGISCFIDPLGKVYDAQPWDTAAAIKKDIPTETTCTLYVVLGDWLSKLFVVLTVLIGLWAIISKWRDKRSV